jgi:hypothetical protein
MKKKRSKRMRRNVDEGQEGGGEKSKCETSTSSRRAQPGVMSKEREAGRKERASLVQALYKFYSFR